MRRGTAQQRTPRGAWSQTGLSQGPGRQRHRRRAPPRVPGTIAMGARWCARRRGAGETLPHGPAQRERPPEPRIPSRMFVRACFAWPSPGRRRAARCDADGLATGENTAPHTDARTQKLQHHHHQTSGTKNERDEAQEREGTKNETGGRRTRGRGSRTRGHQERD